MTAAPEEVIQFNCTWCGMSLTVPARMAGISGPCPKCGNNVTSPKSTPQSALPVQAFSSGIPAAPVHASAPPSIPAPVSSPPLAPASIVQNGNGFHHSPLDPKLTATNSLGVPAANGSLPQPGSSNKGSSMPSLRQHPVATTGNEVPRTRTHTREAGSHDKGKRRGALLGALLMIILALAGAGFFFKDQVSLLWKRAQLMWKPQEGVQIPQSNPAMNGSEKTPLLPTVNPSAPITATTPSTFNPNMPAPKEPTPAIPQVVPGPNLPVPPPANLIKEPITTPSIPDKGSLPTPPPTVPAVKTNDPVEPANKIEQGPDTKSAKKALPVDPSAAQVQVPQQAGTPPSPVALVEVPGSRDKATGNVDSYSGEDKIFVSASPEAQPAATVLKQFFAAKKWQDRLEFIQAPDKMRPLLERYYGANNDGPLRISRIELIRHDRAPEMGSPHCVFQVTGPAIEQPLPVMVESSPEGWKVEWLTFTEFKDKLLIRFLKSYSDEPGRFHVMMRRTHYFDEDVPDLDKKYCFELTPPDPGTSGFVFVQKGNPLARELDRSLGWEITNVAAVVELQWRKQDRYQWVEMTAVPQYNWRGPESAKAAAGPASNDVPGPVVVEKAKPVEDTPPQTARPRTTKK